VARRTVVMGQQKPVILEIIDASIYCYVEKSAALYLTYAPSTYVFCRFLLQMRGGLK